MALFSRFGVELEYMLVDRASLDVRSIADQLLAAANHGVITGDIDRGQIGWSNELTSHLIELKCNGPWPSLDGLETAFQTNIAEVSTLLEPLNARLLPTGMHPWMNPLTETRLWEHEYSTVYAAFDRIFGCQGHGWSNLQASHLNLPFEGDEEFGRLHAAIRLILPLLPGLAASTPIMDGRVTGVLDNRLEVYRLNSRKIPHMAGQVIPEPAFTQADYDRLIFQPLFQQIAPHDPDGEIREEWLNARGAIARFSRGSIEIRVLDVQEHPAADVAICHLIVAVLKALTEERWSPLADQQAARTEDLAALFVSAIRDADRTVIAHETFLRHFGMRGPITIQQLWNTLATELSPAMSPACQRALSTILDNGVLARRIVEALASDESRAAMQRVYEQLADCVVNGESFK